MRTFTRGCEICQILTCKHPIDKTVYLVFVFELVFFTLLMYRNHMVMGDIWAKKNEMVAKVFNQEAEFEVMQEDEI